MDQGKAAAWERAVHSFGQRRQLPALAPHVPVEEPRLRPTAYEMVLAALLLAPVHHKALLGLVHRWPPHLYNLQAFTEATLKRCPPCPKALNPGAPLAAAPVQLAGILKPYSFEV